MDFSVAIVVVFVLHTDGMIGNVRLPQLRLVARERSCPGPQKHSWKAILKGPWKVHGLAKPQWVSFCEVGMAYFTTWEESIGKGGSAYYINVPQTVSAVQVLADIFCIRYVCCRGFGVYLSCKGFGGVYQPQRKVTLDMPWKVHAPPQARGRLFHIPCNSRSQPVRGVRAYQTNVPQTVSAVRVLAGYLLHQVSLL